MTRRFLPSIIGITLTIGTINSYAESNHRSIVMNDNVDSCLKKHGDNNSECLSQLHKKMEQELTTTYKKKLNEISNYDYNQWWMGEKDQRENMKTSFIQSQRLWLKYREDYCKAASAGAEGVDSYGAIILSCQINMGIRRIEEIRMTHTDLSEG